MARRKRDKSESSTKSEGGFKELLSTILWALGIALVLRTFVFQPFTIPSGSMHPGLVEGDYVITSKYSVGYGRHAAAPLPFFGVEDRILKRGPKRGDVVVFKPDGVSDNFIKRVVGLPGDRIQMINGRLHVNGEAVPVTDEGAAVYPQYDGERFVGDRNVEVLRETLPGKEAAYLIYDGQKNNPADDTALITVPPGKYFMMGDNRDFSGDSRRTVREGGAGFVPSTAIIGRAEFVLLSVQPEFQLRNPKTWGQWRGGRFFKRIR